MIKLKLESSLFLPHIQRDLSHWSFMSKVIRFNSAVQSLKYKRQKPTVFVNSNFADMTFALRAHG